MAVLNDDPKNLETLALFISGSVRDAMMAAYVTFVADRWFYRYSEEDQRRLFRTNPANTLTYGCLSARVDRAVVHVADTLKEKKGTPPIGIEVRRKLELALHRDALSHPATVEWWNPRMQEFVDADRGAYEYRPALLWDLSRSINEELRKGNLRVQNESVMVTWEMAVMLCAILEMSLSTGTESPSREHLFAYLQANAAKYQAILERHPDGGRDPEKEQERALKKREFWERMREKWAEPEQS